MMPVLHCLICKRVKLLYKLNKSYGPTDKCPVRDYIIEFLGPCEEALQDDDGICDLCVYLLNKLLYIKRCIYSFIVYNKGGYHFQFAPVYKNFLDNLQTLSYEEQVKFQPRSRENANEAELNQHERPDGATYVNQREDAGYLQAQHTTNEVEPNTNHESDDGNRNVNQREERCDTELLQALRSSSSEKANQGGHNSRREYHDVSLDSGEFQNSDDECDRELLEFAHTSPYDEAIEAKLANQVYPNRRRRGRTRGRGRRRGNNWTRRKGSRSKSRMSSCTEPFSRRNREPSSRMSLYTYAHSERSDGDDEDVASAYADRDGNGVYQSKRTRSVCSQQDEEAMFKFRCFPDCSEEFRNLAALTDHKIKEHNMLAKFICYECYATKFVSQEDLKRHNHILHRILISNCPLCSMELRTVEELQKHIALHKLNSYPCMYCDRSFLNKNTCSKHIAEYHKGRKKRMRRPTTTVNCVYKSEKAQVTVLPDDKYEGQVLFRLQSVGRLRNLCIDTIARHHKGSVDIPHLMEVKYGEGNVNGSNNRKELHSGNEIRSEVEDEDNHDAMQGIEDEESVETLLNVASTSDRNYSGDVAGPNVIANSPVPSVTSDFEKTFAYEHFENFVNRTGPDLLDGEESKSTETKEKANNKSKNVKNREGKRKEYRNSSPVEAGYSNYVEDS